LLNLINNSVKFTEQGCIEASITQLRKDSSSAVLRFSVADTGIGIEKEKLTKIFDSFFQIDGSYTKKYQGTGLGLAIVKNLTNLMGGDVSVQSSAGKGTRFDIDITFKIEAKAYKVAEKPSEEVLPPSTAGAGMSALIVEDDQISAKLAMLMARKQGFKTSHASSGVKAIEMIEKEKFDLVLMDIQLPEMDGMTAIKLIKQRRSEGFQNYDVMIIALTAYALSGDREKFIEAGADEYISKPFNETDFIEKICFVLKKRSESKRLSSESKG
ncbi:MAG TPA: ATP-binding protein, partial [Candidatus Wallbacteria bacterium]|nr:ATP-binding protein [Candidatus Wallbacteria bacterium]